MGIFKNIIDQSILILGFGREGQSTYRLIRKNYPLKHVGIADSNLEISKLIENDPNITFHLGNEYLNPITDYKIIIKTPGISVKNIVIPDYCRVTSQTDLFLQHYSKQIIGITGTKGKSTTTSLIYHILKHHHKNVLIAGNIGKPLFEIIDEIKNDSIIVCEFSSHQLEFVNKGPHIAILLNIFQEHLDHYKSFEAYQKAKFNIALTQIESDFFITSSADLIISDWIKKSVVKSTIEKYSLLENVDAHIQNNHFFVNDICLGIFDDTLPIKGIHNALNIMAALLACSHYIEDRKSIFESIYSFEPLPHRLEFVGNYKGIDFYNDSIATIPEASISAINALKNVHTIILGGFDRGIDYSNFVKQLLQTNIEQIIFTGEAGKRMMELMNLEIYSKKINCIFLDNYESIVKSAFDKTPVGKICLLSPAASSYDSFKNFEHRGDMFKSLIAQYSKD